MTQKSFAQKNLPAAMVAALLTVAITGCSNNTADTTNNSSIISSAQAQESQTPIATDSDASVVQALQSNLQTSGIEGTIISAIPTDMDDIYWVTAEGLPAFFTDKAGKHIIQGQIVAVGGAEPIDISGALIANSAKQALAAVDKKDMVIFPATGETKSVVYAFTDADCGYCRKLHEEMADINARGIEVRYLAWPRSQESVPKMESVWCSQDRKAAMNQAKMGANVQAPSCTNPVADQMALGARLGVRGTPAIFTESGQQVGGYLPADQLAQAVAAAN
ncbi:MULTISPECIES: thioredoxin fold domain-containing protein [unclassified Psychrobacter]|uniref:thioredoxin fold domain-containing protein n=1 Tax=unclassified Psychrobacter TaxID=196806 RepID=UPI003FD1284B